MPPHLTLPCAFALGFTSFIQIHPAIRSSPPAPQHFHPFETSTRCFVADSSLLSVEKSFSYELHPILGLPNDTTSSAWINVVRSHSSSGSKKTPTEETQKSTETVTQLECPPVLIVDVAALAALPPGPPFLLLQQAINLPKPAERLQRLYTVAAAAAYTSDAA
ncbi:hypothetical protein K491DRAFT_680264 [Lophiostoma macrostomum CBS 122681]|uniref:Uncharacterized protein n=1 Tax=Lophiostoma macrostomum CBS 122681 TaxID=1314788 RepID=A0A6A6T1P4_9PLEO|nr:hypothetical protein K491DRAFT_680264 [Lophiostoma macrostomum CBS 122681]